ncbi:MAG TPA: DUF4097 family beta strand repeat-containing protein [Thermoanaerobaculia bacterium]|jgi:hypothetical protein
MRQLPGAAVLAVSVLLSVPAVASLPSRDVAKTLPLEAGESVRVDTYKGSVKVMTWDRAEVAVEARIEADDSCGSPKDAARWVDQTRVVIEKRHGGVSITSDYDALEQTSGWFGGCTARPFVRYTIHMPKDAPLRIKDYKSDLIVKDLAADLDVNTYKGHLDVSGFSGGLRIETYKGEVNAGIVRLAGDVSAGTYKGSIVLHLPGTAGFELSAESGRGSLNVEFPAETGRGSHRRGLVARGAVNGGGPRVSLKTDKGSIALRKG